MKRKATWAVGIWVWLSLATAWAQRAPYQITVSSEPYASLTSFTTHTFQATGALPAEREGQVEIPLPFTFNFFGTDYDRIIAHTNGVVAFEPLRQTGGFLSAPRQVPQATDALNGYISGVWQDLVATASSELRTATLGTVGDRTFVVEYVGFERGGSGAASEANFRVELDEQDFSFRVWFGRVFNISNGTTAAEDGTGVDGVNLLASSSSCMGDCPCDPGRCSAVGGNWVTDRLITAELPNAPELYGQTTADPGARPGQPFDAEFLIDNGGLQDAGTFGVRVLLGPRADDVGSATEIFDGEVSSLTGTSSITLVPMPRLQVPASQPVGRQWLILELDRDDQVPEANEGNNLFSVPFGTGADFTGQVLSAPIQSGAGQTLRATLRIDNLGAPVPSVEAAFYLSRDGVLDGGDRDLGRRSFTLSDGFTAEPRVDLPVPADFPVGVARRLLVVLDPEDDEEELEETNNVFFSEDISFTQADLSLFNLSTPGQAYRGAEVPLQVQIQNSGGSTASNFTVCFFLTGASSPSSQDLIFESDPLSLPTGVTRLRARPRVPDQVQTGEINLFVRVDCANSTQEDDETNNSLSDRLVVAESGPDFEPDLLGISAEAEAGEPLALRVRVVNRGPESGVPALVLRLERDSGVSGVPSMAVSIPVATEGDALAPLAERTFDAAPLLPQDLPSGVYGARIQIDQPDDVVAANDADPPLLSDTLPQVQVNGFSLAIDGVPPPRATVGLAYSHAFVGLGGEASERSFELTWVDGSPPGVDVMNGRVLQGVPTQVGSYPFRLRLDRAPQSLEVESVLAVDPVAPELLLVDRILPPAVAGAAYRHELRVLGGIPPYAFELEDPQGQFFVTQGGLVSGTPPGPRALLLPLQVEDAVGNRLSATLALDVLDPEDTMEIGLPALPSGLVGRLYQVTVPVRGGTEPLQFRLQGNLPPGVDFQDGTFSGTPTLAGTWPLVLTVEDANGLFDQDPLLFEVIEAGTLFIPATDLPVGLVGRDYLRGNAPVELVLEGQDPDSPVTWMVGSGQLPPGIQLMGPRLAGRPTQTGVFSFEIIARDPRGDVARQFLGIAVEEPLELEDSGGCRGSPGVGGLLPGLLVAGWLHRARRRRNSVEVSSA